MTNSLTSMSCRSNTSYKLAWRQRNMATAVLSVVLVLTTLTALAVTRTSAQLTVAPSRPATADQGQLTAPLVDWSNARRVYRMAEEWLEHGQPGQPFHGQAIEVTGLTGVRVTLRWLGLRMGTGQVTFDNARQMASLHDRGPDPTHVVDLTAMTGTALRGAMMQVNDKLNEARQRAISQPGEAGEKARKTPAKTIADLSGSLLMDIQIAGRLTPIELTADAPAAAIYHHFAPGYNGLRLTTIASDGTPLSSWLWPADALAADLTPHSQILQLMGGLDIKLNQEPQIARPGGPQLQSFEVIHMVRPGLDQPITRLIRGNVLLPPTSIDSHTLDAMTLRLAAHLGRRQRDDGRFHGTYLPTTDSYEQQLALPQDGALACLALSRWAAGGILDSNSAQVIAANKTVGRWVDARIKSILDPKASPAPATIALTLMTLTENPTLAALQIQRDMLAKRLLRLRSNDGSFRVNEDPKAEQVDVPVGALIADALAAVYLQSRDKDVAAALPDSMAWVWERTDPLRSLGALPWLLETDARLETLTTQDGQNALNPRAARTARLAKLVPTLGVLFARQIVTPPTAGPADVVGGFDLHNTDPNSPPNPDWRTAHMLMVISQSLRNEHLKIGANRVQGILTCGRAARFLAQLMFDEPGTYYVRNPADVIGGVRPILWDNRLDLAPTAMTLLAACDLHKTLAQWSESQK